MEEKFGFAIYYLFLYSPITCSIVRLIIHRCESDISLAKRKPLVSSFTSERFGNSLSVTSLRTPSPPKTHGGLKNG